MKLQLWSVMAATLLALGIPSAAAVHEGVGHANGTHGPGGWGAGEHHRHFRGHFGLIVEDPLFWDPWFREPPAVQEQQTPQVFLQQGGAPGYYFCTGAGYYPAVTDCPTGWQFVPRNPEPGTE